MFPKGTSSTWADRCESSPCFTHTRVDGMAKHVTINTLRACRTRPEPALRTRSTESRQLLPGWVAGVQVAPSRTHSKTVRRSSSGTNKLPRYTENLFFRRTLLNLFRTPHCNSPFNAHLGRWVRQTLAVGRNRLRKRHAIVFSGGFADFGGCIEQFDGGG